MTEEVPLSLEEQLKEMKEKYLRALAEQENARKRLQKERDEYLAFGVENAIGEFLPAIDQLENALRFAESGSPELQSWGMGFQMILAQFKEVLNQHGIVSFTSEGHTYDPHLHEAVEIVETAESPDGQILKEFAKGYKSARRTLRPARVKVARAPTPQPVEQL